MEDSRYRQVDFETALKELAAMMGESVLVTVSLGERFFGVGFRSCLQQVETMPPDYTSVVLRFEHREALELDPEEVEVFLAGRPDGSKPRWLEFHVIGGPVVHVEAVELDAATS
jgi:hypothetical protein